MSSFFCDEIEAGLTSVDCVTCGVRFSYAKKSGPGRLRRTCSDECKAIRDGRQIAESFCAHCGNGFRARHSFLGPANIYCSRKCVQAKKLIYPDARSKKNASESRRRARKRGVGYEQFSNIEIFERDGWWCGICGFKVDKRLKKTNQMSASLDHIVPISKGGSHTRINSQCAHWICNSRKSAGAGGQLRLLP